MYSAKPSLLKHVRFYLLLCALLLCFSGLRGTQAQVVGGGGSSNGGSSNGGTTGGGPGTSGPSGGGPPSRGKWLIDVTYTGTAQATLSENITQGTLIPGTFAASVQNVNIIPNTPTQLSWTANVPPETSTGGITGSLSTTASYSGFANLTQTGQATVNLSGAQMVFTLRWQPLNGDWVHYPAPPMVAICSRRRITCVATAGFNYLTYVGSVGSDPGASFDGSGFAHIDVTGTLAGLGTTATADSPGNGTQTKTTPDEPFVVQVLNVSGGMAQTQFDISGGMGLTMGNYWPLGIYSIQGTSTVLMDFCVAGFDLDRFDSKLNGVSGGHNDGSEDPSFTRWLPLAFSPTISSQPFRNQPGALPAPWGNVNCAYSISMQRESNPPNLDLNGQSSLFVPTGPYGNFNNPGPPYNPLLGTFLPYYVITDANGDRLIFDKHWNPYPDIHSTVSYAAGTLTLSNAGPPGALKSLGNYTYTFQTVAVDGTNGDPISAVLLSIAQPINAQNTNLQTLQWNAGSNFLTVIDSTTGQSTAQVRKLNFYVGANGYLSGVDTSMPFTSLPYTHTGLTFDGGGHMTSLQVYTGNGQTLLHQDSYAYGGPNGDSITGTQKGFAISSYVFAADPLSTDSQGLPIPRLTTALYGNSADARSSDDGYSIQGIVQYTWGPTQVGFGDAGDVAHTNTITDPLGNPSLVKYGLTGGLLGVLSSVTVTGPDYVGTPAGSNISNIYYEPDVLNPTSIQFYDPLNNLGQRLHPWTSTFDKYGNLLTTVDPLFNTWTLVYDATGQNLLSTQDPTGQLIQFAYGENNNPPTFLTSFQDAAGLTRLQMNYNQYGQPLTQTVPAGASGSGLPEVTTLNYDPITGDVTGIVDELGDQATINSYDPLGDPLSMSLFPDTGNPATSLTPLTSTVVWDAAQQLVQSGLPNGVNIQSFRTNSTLTDLQVRAPVAAGSSLLSQIHYDYDSRGRVYNVADLLGTVAQFRFDKNSNPTRILDAAGHATQLNYGHNNELTSMIWPDQQHSRYLFYDSAGRVQSTVDENFQLVQYLYDAADRITDVIRPANPSQNIHVTYDAADRPLTISDGTGQRQYTYDPVQFRLTRVRTILSALPAGSNVFDVSYGYNPDGSVANITSPAGTTFYSYDAAGQLIRLVDPFGNITTWSRDHIGRTLQQTTHTAAGATLGTAYTYGNSNQPGDNSSAPVFLSGITQTVNNQVSYSYSLQHDYLGNLLAMQGTGANPGQQRSAAFTYDQRGRMTSAQESFSPNAQTTFTSTGNYLYDLCNNLMSGGGGWTYNANNQLTNAPASGGLPGASGLQYDGTGNTTAIDGHTLAYDTQNQLAAVDNSVSYTHDASGHMTSRTAGGQTTYFLYSGDSLIAEVDGTGTVTRAYTWGEEGLISTQSGNVPTFARFDPLGNLSGQLNGLGAVVQEMAYKAYGGSLGPPAANTSFAWQGISGAYTDGNFPGLVLAGSRPYLPDVGRFASPSPSGSDGVTNPYTYAGGNPANYAAPGLGDDDNESDYASNGAFWGHAYRQGARELTSMPAYQPGSEDRRKLSGMAMAIPYAGEAYMGYMVVTGNDPVAGTCLSMGERALTLACLAAPGVASKIGGKLERMCILGRGCFVAGTLVQVATQEEAAAQLAKNKTSGKKGKKSQTDETLHTVTKPIEQVREGDLVASRNPVSGKTELRQVVTTSKHTVMKLIVLSLADAKTGKVVETITTTAEHPFAVKAKGFVVAGQLAIGNAIVTRAGPALVIKSKQVQAQPKGVPVYNLVVEGDHTYFVGTFNGGTWVHNGGPCVRPEIPARLPDRVTKELAEGEMRTPAENQQARDFFKNNREAAKAWWEARTGQSWPSNATHYEHPRPLKSGGDPLYVEPGFDGPSRPHMDAGDFRRWGAMGGRPRTKPM